jgi:hypothetical protein
MTCRVLHKSESVLAVLNKHDSDVNTRQRLASVCYCFRSPYSAPSIDQQPLRPVLLPRGANAPGNDCKVLSQNALPQGDYRCYVLCHQPAGMGMRCTLFCCDNASSVLTARQHHCACCLQTLGPAAPRAAAPHHVAQPYEHRSTAKGCRL